MLAVDTSKRLFFTKFIADGDLVIVYERHDAMKAVNVNGGGSVFHNQVWSIQTFRVDRKTIQVQGIQQQGGICILTVYITRAMDVGAQPSNPNSLYIYTFDFHDQRAASAREDFERTGVNSGNFWGTVYSGLGISR